jgi:drug/metabolite transporter (DMT)-like permease
MEATRRWNVVLMLLSVVNLLAVGVLADGFLNQPVRTFLIEETPHTAPIIGLIFLVLCVNAILLARCAFRGADPRRVRSWFLGAVNVVCTCLCAFAAYAAFQIHAVWSATVAVALSVIFLLDVLFLRGERRGAVENKVGE